MGSAYLNDFSMNDIQIVDIRQDSNDQWQISSAAARQLIDDLNKNDTMVLKFLMTFQR